MLAAVSWGIPGNPASGDWLVSVALTARSGFCWPGMFHVLCSASASHRGSVRNRQLMNALVHAILHSRSALTWMLVVK